MAIIWSITKKSTGRDEVSDQSGRSTVSQPFGSIHMTAYMEGCVLAGCSGLKGLSDRSSRCIAQV